MDDDSVDKELAGWSHSKCLSQQLYVQVETSEEWRNWINRDKMLLPDLDKSPIALHQVCLCKT